MTENDIVSSLEGELVKPTGERRPPKEGEYYRCEGTRNDGSLSANTILPVGSVKRALSDAPSDYDRDIYRLVQR